MLRCLLPVLFLIACAGKDDDTTDVVADTDTDTDADTDADTDTDTDTDTDVPLTGYAFASRIDGKDSVAFDGQTMRHVLIDEMKAHIGGLTNRIDTGFFPVEGEVASELEFYLAFDSTTSGSVPLSFSSTPAPLQSVFDDISTDKDLLGKLAGNDPVGQHKDWATDLVGWEDGRVTTPESLVRLWISEIDAAAVERSNGSIPLDPVGDPIVAVYLSADGVDRQQLLEKFLRGAIAFSQGADDYLDDDEAGKGLLSDHTAADGTSNYTPLEHAWDEGFGYFGAARTYGTWSDESISDPGYSDVNTDGAIDLHSEVCFGHSANAGKRDLGAIVATDFTQEAWDGFYNGRALLAATTTTLTPAELEELQGHRDEALDAWEKAIAATVVHYINDTLRDMGTFDTVDYSFTDHAKHWSEMKGFALAMQFNPRSPISTADFVELHQRLGDAPALSTDSGPDQTQYINQLLAARTLIGDAYGFDVANLGDGSGNNGW